jgi:hypothetical protein
MDDTAFIFFHHSQRTLQQIAQIIGQIGIDATDERTAGRNFHPDPDGFLSSK